MKVSYCLALAGLTLACAHPEGDPGPTPGPDALAPVAVDGAAAADLPPEVASPVLDARAVDVAAGATSIVMTGNFYARPTSLTVRAGDSVKWIRVDGEHNIVAATVHDGAAACDMPTADFGPLSLAPPECVASDGLGHTCSGCPGGYVMGPYCVGPHNVTGGYTVRFTKPGTYGFIDTRNNHCRIGIRGVITVVP